MLVYRLISPEKKSYVGFTEKTLKQRLRQHKNDAKKLDYDLHRAIRKYPIDQWKATVLEECTSRNELEDRERYYIKKFDSYKNGYNMTLGGDGLDPETASKLRKKWWKTAEGKKWKKEWSERMKKTNPSKKGSVPWNKGLTGVTSHTEKTKAKISIKNKRIMPDKLRQAWAEGKFDNRVRTAEHNQKISESMMGHETSELQKQRASEANQKQWIVTDPDGKEYKITNLRQFALERGLDPGNMSRGGSKKWKARTQ